MKIDRDKLTAYALGELSGADAKEVEAAIAKDPALRRLVDETRAFAQSAERDLRAEPLPGGRGAAPVLAEIARRSQERAPQARRAWVQAGALGALIVLLMLALPLRKQFQGNVAKIIGTTQTETAETTDDDHLTHRKVREDPDAVTRALQGLRDRSRTSHAIPGCRFALPNAGPGDRERAEADSYAVSYILTGSALEVDVTVRSGPQPLDVGAEEVAAVESATLFRRVSGEQSVSYYVVPAKKAQPLCQVQVSTDWILPEGVKKPLGAGFDELARSLAEGLVLRQ